MPDHRAGDSGMPPVGKSCIDSEESIPGMTAMPVAPGFLAIKAEGMGVRVVVTDNRFFIYIQTFHLTVAYGAVDSIRACDPALLMIVFPVSQADKTVDQAALGTLDFIAAFISVCRLFAVGVRAELGKPFLNFFLKKLFGGQFVLHVMRQFPAPQNRGFCAALVGMKGRGVAGQTGHHIAHLTGKWI